MLDVEDIHVCILLKDLKRFAFHSGNTRFRKIFHGYLDSLRVYQEKLFQMSNQNLFNELDSNKKLYILSFQD